MESILKKRTQINCSSLFPWSPVPLLPGYSCFARDDGSFMK